MANHPAQLEQKSGHVSFTMFEENEQEAVRRTENIIREEEYHSMESRSRGKDHGVLRNSRQVSTSQGTAKSQNGIITIPKPN